MPPDTCSDIYGARLAKLDESSCRTVALEVGLQNGGMATALAINTLKDPLAALAPAIFGPWMNISGSMLASWWAAPLLRVKLLYNQLWNAQLWNVRKISVCNS